MTVLLRFPDLDDNSGNRISLRGEFSIGKFVSGPSQSTVPADFAWEELVSSDNVAIEDWLVEDMVGAEHWWRLLLHRHRCLRLLPRARSPGTTQFPRPLATHQQGWRRLCRLVLPDLATVCGVYCRAWVVTWGYACCADAAGLCHQVSCRPVSAGLRCACRVSAAPPAETGMA